MTGSRELLVLLALVLAPTGEVLAFQSSCGDRALTLQVLGSGGPFPRDDRASSSYLVWVDGRARVMVDAGGGAFVRFGEAGARIEDLQVLAISHFHPDHVSDLPALLWGSDFFRTDPLRFIGPSGDETYPGASAFLGRLFGENDGAFPILAATVGREGRGVPLDVTTIDAEQPQPSVVLDTEDLGVSALGVPHNAPALAYRVEVGGVSVVFSSDQNGTDPSFVDFARDATVLVMHLAVSESSQLQDIHARPSVVGRIAQDAGVGKLVLSHFLGVEPEHSRFDAFSLADLAANVAVVRRHYSGELVVADDLVCIDLRQDR